MSAIDEIIKTVGDGGSFPVPVDILFGIVPTPGGSPYGLKLLTALFWLAGPMLRQGERAVFRVPLPDLLLAAGLQGVVARKHVATALIEGWQWPGRSLEAKEGDGVMSPMFDEILADPDGFHLDVIFSDIIFASFWEMERYGLLDIRDVAEVSKASDMVFFWRIAGVRRMRNPWFALDRQDVCNLLAVDPAGHFGGYLRRLDRVRGRVAKISGDQIEIEKVQKRGSREIEKLRVMVAQRKAKGRRKTR